MQVKEVQEKKKVLTERICRLIDEFNNETNTRVTGMSVEYIDHRSSGEGHPNHLMVGIGLYVEI